MEPVRFTLGKLSSLVSKRVVEAVQIESEDGEEGDVIDTEPRIRLMYSANEGDIEGIKELLDLGTDENFRDDDERTSLHVAACQQDQNLLPEFDFDHEVCKFNKNSYLHLTTVLSIGSDSSIQTLFNFAFAI
ncbi:hypothetical protein P3S68_001350 [Capsicum galapagoense]